MGLALQVSTIKSVLETCKNMRAVRMRPAIYSRLKLSVGRIQRLNCAQNTQRLGRHEHPLLPAP